MRFSAFVVLFLLSTFCFAGNSAGKIEQIMVHQGDYVMFRVGAHHDKPSCSTAGADWALSLSSEKGRAMYALLLSAASQNHSVTVVGSNTCSWPDRESPNYIYVNYR